MSHLPRDTVRQASPSQIGMTPYPHPEKEKKAIKKKAEPPSPTSSRLSGSNFLSLAAQAMFLKLMAKP